MLNTDKNFKINIKRIINNPLYNIAKPNTRQYMLENIIDTIKESDYDALSKKNLGLTSTKLYITENDLKEVKSIIKKGCKDFTLSIKFIIEMCICLAIRKLTNDGYLGLAKNKIDTSIKPYPISIAVPYLKMLQIKMEPKYSKMSIAELTTMAIKYVIENKFYIIKYLNKASLMSDSDESFVKELYKENIKYLEEFDTVLMKNINSSKNVNTTTANVYNYISNEFIIRYYKMDKVVFKMIKTVEKAPQEIKQNDDEDQNIPDPIKEPLAYAQYMSEKIYGKEEENAVSENINGEVKVVNDSPKATNSSDVNDEDDWIMMKILKLRRQLKHTKLEIIIKE